MPTIRLNETTLAAIPVPRERPQEYYWDTVLPGLGVIVGRSGAKTFVARSWINGKNRRVKIGIAGQPRGDGATWSVALARDEAKTLIGKMSAGVDLNAVKREEREERRFEEDRPTMRDAYEAHVARLRRRNRSEQTIATVKKEMEKYLADWLDRPISEMRGADLIELHDQIKREAKSLKGTNPNNPRGAPLANRVIAHVSACWNTLNKKLEGKLGTWNPAKSVERDRLVAKRECIGDTDLGDWYARVRTMRNPIQCDGLVFALFTGLRSEDVRSIRYEHVDWKERSLVLPDSKVGQSFKIPLPKTCIEIIRRRRKNNGDSPLFASGDGGFVFPGIDNGGKVGPISDLRQQVHNGTEHGRFPVEDIHTLRRTYEAVAHECGITELDQDVLTSHAFSSHNVTASYISQPHLARCQAKIEAALWKRIRTRRRRSAKAA